MTHIRADVCYSTLLKQNESVIFERKFANGFKSDYELALLEIGKSNDPVIKKDEYGRQIKIELEDSDYKILKINNYKTEDLFWDYNNNCKISSQDFISKYLKKSGLKLISKLNNKIVLQNDENINLFTFKNDSDAERFIDVMTDHFMEIKRSDVIFVKDISTAQRKYLYDFLIEKGYHRSYLFRQATTHPVKK